MNKTFTFNGAHASTKYIKAIRTQRPLVAERKHTFVDIPFLDGSFLLSDKARNDIVITVECLLNIPTDTSIFDVGRTLTTWFNLDNWSTLIFDDDPNYKYDAIVTNTITVEDIKKPEIVIEFRCKPVMVMV